MRKSLILLTLITSAFAWGCQKEAGTKTDPSTPKGGFNFETMKSYPLSVNYALSGYDHQIYFEVYAEYPFVSSSRQVIKEGVKPILRVFADAAGQYNGKVLAPIHADNLYLYSRYSGVPNLIALPVTGGALSFDITKLSDGISGSRAAHTVPAGVSMPLGDWDALGRPSYLTGQTSHPNGLATKINGIFVDTKDLTKRYSKMFEKTPVYHLTKNNNKVGIELVFFHSSATQKNAIGYYTYPEGQEPASLADVHLMMAFPNVNYNGQGGNLASGDRVKLKYWNGSSYSFDFPTHTCIGFFMIPDGFDPATGNVKDLQKYFANANLSPAQAGAQFAAFWDSGNGIMVFGGEETSVGAAGCDKDYNDMIFYINSDPRQLPGEYYTIDPDPDPEPDDPELLDTEYFGTLIFEDLWPSQGDYDLNDNVVEYSCVVWRDMDNNIVYVEDTFRPVHNGATLQSAFAYQYGVPSSQIASVNVTTTMPEGADKLYKDYVAIPWAVDAKGFELGQANATLKLYDDIRSIVGVTNPEIYEWNIVTEFSEPVSEEVLGLPPYNPFIVVARTTDANPRTREVHLPLYAPSDNASWEWFDTGHDKTSVYGFYTSDDNYPFAINIPMHDFQLAREKAKIDTEYQYYHDWASSFGELHPDWYEFPN